MAHACLSEVRLVSVKTVRIDWICGKERDSLRDDLGGQIYILLGTELDS